MGYANIPAEVKLSKLEIDTSKDWEGYLIKNLGAPVDSNDALRKAELDSHQTASPIDHPDGSVTSAKIADGAVTSAKIADGTIRNADIADDAAIADSKIAFTVDPASHASRHADGGADEITSPLDLGAIPDLDASKITSGRFPMARMPDGTSGYVLTAKGAGADPAYEAIAAGGDAYLVVAAADTPATLKNRADYVCDGTADTGGDQAEINSALDAADVVILCPGTYWIDAPISMASGKSLVGGGAGCVLKLKNGIDADINMIVNSDTTNGNDHIVIKNLKLDGNRANQTAGIQRGIYFIEVAPSGTTPGCKIEGCFVENFRSYGINLSSSSNNTISGNMVQGNYYGIYLDSSSKNTISGNMVQGNSYYGIFLSSSSNNTISGNTCQDNGSCGIDLTSSSKNTISGNMCQDNGSCGIYLDSSSNNTISGNMCQGNSYYGIYLTSSSNNTISGNMCLENSQSADNSYDNIYLADSDYNLIVGNVCRRGALTNKPRYGINISNDACDRNCLIGNDLYDSGSTGDLNDVPTTNPTLKHDNRNNAGDGWLTEV